MDRGLQTPALVLLDEVGSGTDPVEGGALGVAVVDHFRRRGATVIATSHYDALKTYASTTDGVASAAFGFDAETFAPTYELLYGSPGRSLALEIAKRLGLAPSIVSTARQNLTEREAQLAEHLAKIDKDLRDLEHQKRLVAHERETVGGLEARMREREDALRQREETFRRRLNDELDNELRRARKQIEDVISDLKTKTAAAAREVDRQTVTTGDTGAMRSDARSAVDTIVRQFTESSAPQAAPAFTGTAPSVGDRVVLSDLGLEGVVTAVHDGTAELDVRGKRMRASLRDLRVVGGPKPAGAGNVKVHVELQPREGSLSDLNVVGCTVDEALSRAERFLDDTEHEAAKNQFFDECHEDQFGTGDDHDGQAVGTRDEINSREEQNAHRQRKKSGDAKHALPRFAPCTSP
jgi:DNA mismatch repair protein MutS2